MAERLAILSAGDDFGGGVRAHLSDADSDVVLESTWISADWEDLAARLAAAQPTVAFVDLNSGGADEASLAAFAGRRHWEMEKEVLAGEKLPRAIALVLELLSLRERLPGLLLFVFYHGAGIHLTQILLRRGVDWVWADRVPGQLTVARVITKLRLLLNRRRPLNILVVDNSAEARASISSVLCTRHYVTQIKSGLPESELDVSSDDIISEFLQPQRAYGPSRHGDLALAGDATDNANTGSRPLPGKSVRYDAVVMDLGLTISEERDLETHVLPDPIAVFLLNGEDYYRQAIGGVRGTRWILDNCPLTVVVIVSHYVKDAEFVAALNASFSPHQGRVSYFGKDPASLQALADAVEQLWETCIPLDAASVATR